MVQFHQCDHGVQEVQWVQGVQTYHPYQMNRQIQKAPIKKIQSLKA